MKPSVALPNPNKDQGPINDDAENSVEGFAKARMKAGQCGSVALEVRCLQTAFRSERTTLPVYQP